MHFRARNNVHKLLPKQPRGSLDVMLNPAQRVGHLNALRGENLR